jgi:hypothetical protein
LVRHQFAAEIVIRAPDDFRAVTQAEVEQERNVDPLIEELNDFRRHRSNPA